MENNPLTLQAAIHISGSPATRRGWLMRRLPDMLLCLVVLLGAYECCISFSQLMGWTISGNPRFNLTGTFYNPGPLGGFIAVALTACVGLNFHMREGAAQWMEWVKMIVIGAMLMMLIATMSRGGWIATFAGCSVMLWPAIKPHKRWVAISLPVVAMLFVGAYMMKKDSAHGRLLMWKVGVDAVAEHPLGVGWAHVSGAYGDAQEQYFSQGCGSEIEKQVAGCPEYLFNEYLQVGLAWGIPAMIAMVALLACGILCALRSGNRTIAGALIALSVFAFTSYPLQFPRFWLMLGSLLSGAFISVFKNCKWGVAASTLLLLASAFAIGLPWMRQRSYSKAEAEYLHNQRHLFHAGAYEAYINAIIKFTGITSNDSTPLSEEGLMLKDNPEFLFDYSMALHKLQRYEQSNRLLYMAMGVSADPMILNLIAKNHIAMGHLTTAEQWLKRAANRVPGRIYPHYLLCRLYADHPDNFPSHLLESEINTVLTMPHKVSSPALNSIRCKVRSLIQSKS